MGRRRRRGDASRAPADLGLRLRHGEPADCGLCGQTVPLTRTHVPPQCAGNSQGVQRHYLQTVTADGVPTVVRARKSWAGGLYVYGLCGQCNSNAGRWDGAYGALATALRPCWSSGVLATPGGRIDLPSYEFSPSSVARSVLMGMFGVNRGLRARHPALAQGLLDAAEPLALPPDLRLRVALAKGTTAGSPARSTQSRSSARPPPAASRSCTATRPSTSRRWPGSWPGTGRRCSTSRAGPTPPPGSPSRSPTQPT